MVPLTQVQNFCAASGLNRISGYSVRPRTAGNSFAWFTIVEDSEVFPGEVWWSPFIGMQFFGMLKFSLPYWLPEEQRAPYLDEVHPVRLMGTKIVIGRSIPGKYLSIN